MGPRRPLRGPRRPALESELDEALAAAQAFRERYRGKLGELSAAELTDAVAELERIKSDRRRGSRPSRGSGFAADTSDQARGALVQKVRERNTRIETELLFFDLEWGELDDDVAERLLADPALERYANVLRSERRYRPYLLSEPEERISAEKSVTGVSAWDRLFDELLSDLRVSLDGEEPRARRGARAALAADRPGGARRASPRPSPRRCGRACARAATSSTRSSTSGRSRTGCAATRPGSRPATSPTRSRTRRRRASSTRSSPATTSRSASTRSRRGCSGCRGSHDFDRYAPLQEAGGTIAWDDARELVLEAFTGFSPVAGEIVGDFFERDWIDAAAAAGEDPRRLLRDARPRRPPVRAHELRRRAAERADARARARPRPARRRSRRSSGCSTRARR